MDKLTGSENQGQGRPVPILLAIYQLSVGGAERDVAKLARYLNPRLYQAHVACFHGQGERRAELDAAGIPILELPVRSFINGTAIEGAKQVKAYIKQHGIQLIQAFDDPTSIYFAPLGRALGVPAVLTSHLYFRHLVKPPNYYLLKLADWFSHRIVVNAAAIAAHLERDHGVRRDRVLVSHNGVETNVFYPAAEPREKGLEDATVVIGALCVFRPEKRLDVLLQAFAQVKDEVAGAKLLLVGDGPMWGEYERMRDELGLMGRSVMVRTSGNVPHWMRQMDVFVMCSISEGFPNALLEAMATGCAPVASRVGGIPELVEDGVSGLLFTAGEADDLAGKLRELLRNETQRREMAAKAAVRAREVFSMEQAARRMEKYYTELLAK